jgi:hypothetical protein
MNWIFISFLVASILHVVEEYIYPGGFTTQMKKLNPKISPVINLPSIIIINGLQMLLCVVIIFVGESNLTFSLSAAGLLFINGIIHIIAVIKKRGYAPGVVTGVFIYLPLSIYAYQFYLSSGKLDIRQFIISAILGAVFQIVPFLYFAVVFILKRISRSRQK